MGSGEGQEVAGRSNIQIIMIRFIHISDTHIGPAKDFTLQGVPSYPAFQTVIRAIKALPLRPDFILHTGDIVASPDGKSYALFRSLIEQIDMPVYYVTGNHDDSDDIKKYLLCGEKEDLGEAINLSYRFIHNGIHFLILDGRGKPEIDPHGILTDAQLNILQQELAASDTPLVIAIHFPALPLDSLWLDRDMLLLNGTEFHRIITPYAQRICGVFLGHIHRGMQVHKDGILYSSVGSTCVQFRNVPTDSKPVCEPIGHGYFNIVTVIPEQTMVKEYTVPLLPLIDPEAGSG